MSAMRDSTIMVLDEMDHEFIFHHRTFVWHIWHSLHDGFAVLVNYHGVAVSEGILRSKYR